MTSLSKLCTSEVVCAVSLRPHKSMCRQALDVGAESEGPAKAPAYNTSAQEDVFLYVWVKSGPQVSGCGIRAAREQHGKCCAPNAFRQCKTGERWCMVMPSPC
jgi:hypothetical protein